MPLPPVSYASAHLWSHIRAQMMMISFSSLRSVEKIYLSIRDHYSPQVSLIRLLFLYFQEMSSEQKQFLHVLANVIYASRQYLIITYTLWMAQIPLYHKDIFDFSWRFITPAWPSIAMPFISFRHIFSRQAAAFLYYLPWKPRQVTTGHDIFYTM